MISGKTTSENYIQRMNAKFDHEGKGLDEEGGFPWFGIAKWIGANIIHPIAKEYVFPWVMKQGRRLFKGRGGILLPGERYSGGNPMDAQFPSQIPMPHTAWAPTRYRNMKMGGKAIDFEAVKKWIAQQGERVQEIAEDSGDDIKEFVKKVISEAQGNLPAPLKEGD